MGRRSLFARATHDRVQFRADMDEFCTPGDRTSILFHCGHRPIMRYNPAVVAQAFATMGAMYPGRVGIGVGSGEELNEVAVLGGEWPSPGKRLDMLAEALTIMNRLWT